MTHNVILLFQKYRNLFLYAVIGCSGIAIDIVTFYVLFNYIHLYVLLSNGISISLGITNNFIWNLLFNFKTKDKILKRFMMFYLVGMSGLLISSLILFVGVHIFNMNAVIVKIVSTVIIISMQYLLNSKITFKS